MTQPPDLFDGTGDDEHGSASPTEDADLDAALCDAQHGSEDGFRLLYRAVQPGLLRYLRVLAGGEDNVGEYCADVLAERPGKPADVPSTQPATPAHPTGSPTARLTGAPDEVPAQPTGSPTAKPNAPTQTPEHPKPKPSHPTGAP